MFTKLLTTTLILIGVCQVSALPKHCKPKLRNGDFETGRLRPWFDASTSLGSTNEVTKGHKSKYGLSLTPENTGSPSITTYAFEEQSLTLCPNTTYTLSWDYRYTVLGNNAAFFAYAKMDGSDSTIFESIANEHQIGKWYHASVPFTVPSSQSGVGFVAQSSDAQVTYDVDNAVLVLGS